MSEGEATEETEREQETLGLREEGEIRVRVWVRVGK